MPAAVPRSRRGRPHADGAPVVLGDGSLEVGRGELFGLFGPDGAGNTTLVNAP
ncbi:MAG TPA: hypothetical protein VFE78_39250 [Gemmataceae bacterium]|nr:hypothetical protein [Gemmataceae bacterium]